jgi:hypothetical protein
LQTSQPITLQDDKYVASNNPAIEKALGAMGPAVSSSAIYLFDFFHKKKKELNHYWEPPTAGL